MNENEDVYVPDIPEGEEGISGDHLDDVEDVEATLLKTEWVEEAEQIPLDSLSDGEKIVILKCREKMTLTDAEQEQLQNILGRFRPAIREIKPAEVLENVESNEGLISDIDTFLDVSDKFNEVQELRFPVQMGDTTVTLWFDVHPIMDSTAVLDLGRLSLFQDFTQDEFLLYSKKHNGEALTREEEAITKHLEDKLTRLSEVKQKQIILEFLAMQLTFHGHDNTYEEMKNALEHIPFAYITVLFYRVQQMTGVNNVQVEESFQEAD